MKYIEYESFEKLLRRVITILYDYLKENNTCKNWHICRFIQVLFKKYDKHIILKYSCTFHEYTEYISLDIYKAMTTYLEDYICNTKDLNEEIINIICLIIHKTRSKIIKNAC